MFNGIRGVFIRVNDIEHATEKYLKIFGGKLTQRHKFDDLGFDTSVIEYENDTFIEIISPLSDTSPVQKALDKFGEGVHLIAWNNNDPAQTVNELRAMSLQLINDPGEGNPITQQIFIHPKELNGMMALVSGTPTD